MGLLPLLTSAIVTDPVELSNDPGVSSRNFNKVQHDIRYKLRNRIKCMYSQQRVISKQYNTIIGEVPVTDALPNKT